MGALTSLEALWILAGNLRMHRGATFRKKAAGAHPVDFRAQQIIACGHVRLHFSKIEVGERCQVPLCRRFHHAGMRAKQSTRNNPEQTSSPAAIAVPIRAPGRLPAHPPYLQSRELVIGEYGAAHL